MPSTRKSTFATHTHVVHKSVLGQREADQDSEVPWILQKYLGTSLNKTRTWYQHHALNFTVCCSCISWNFYLLRTQQQGYRKVMCGQRTKGRAVHTPLCLDQDAPRLFKTEFALPVVAKLQFWIQNLSYSSAPEVHTQMLEKHRKNRSIPKQAVPITHSRNNHNF